MNLPATESTHPAPEPRPDLSAEAMRRRLRASLFGDPIAPLMIARFEVLDTLGEGGMGIVHAALDPELDRVVAIKVIRDDRDDRYRDRLLREARALARVSHPNVVQVHEVGETSEGVFIAMEYVPGTTLGRWLQAAPRGLDEILDKFTEAARGLAAAHRAGLVHRDFKPANALVGEDGRVRIADFGLARPVGPPHASPSSPHLRSTLRRRGSGDSDTDTGVVAGTPAYMPPEQLRGLDVDARSDVFAFCIALYEATHGQRPHDPDDRLGGRPLPLPPPLPERRVPRWLRRLLTRGLALAPDERFPSMVALLEALDAGRGRPRRFAAVTAIAALFSATALAAVLLGPSEARCSASDARAALAWDDDARAAIAASFAASGLPHAPFAADRLAAELDRYTAALADARRETCADTRIRGQRSEELLDRGMICLDRNARALAGLVDLARAGHPRTIAAIDDLVADLPAIAPCRDAAALLDSARDAPSPLLVAARNDLDRAHRLWIAGHPDDALPLADRARALATALHEPRIAARAWLLRGTIAARDAHDADAAAIALDRAYVEALRAHEPWIHSAVLAETAFLDAHVREDPAAARRALERARALEGDDAPASARADLLATEALVARLEGDHRRAADLSLDDLEIRRTYLPAASPPIFAARARHLLALADAAAAADPPAAGDREAALRRLGDLLDEARQGLGATHPTIATIALILAQIRLEDGHADAARDLATEARDALRASFGDDHPLLATSDLTLALAAADAGAAQAAIAHAEAALAAFERHYPPGYSDTLMTLALLAALFMQTGDDARALEVHLALLDGQRRAGKDLDRDGVLTNIGNYLCDAERCDEAAPYFREALARLADRRDAPPASLAAPLHGLARVFLGRGEPAHALPLLIDTEALLRDDPETDPAALAALRADIDDTRRTLVHRGATSIRAPLRQKKNFGEDP